MSPRWSSLGAPMSKSVHWSSLGARMSKSVHWSSLDAPMPVNPGSFDSPVVDLVGLSAASFELLLWPKRSECQEL